jgi:hypothetical protein
MVSITCYPYRQKKSSSKCRSSSRGNEAKVIWKSGETPFTPFTLILLCFHFSYYLSLSLFLLLFFYFSLHRLILSWTSVFFVFF